MKSVFDAPWEEKQANITNSPFYFIIFCAASHWMRLACLSIQFPMEIKAITGDAWCTSSLCNVMKTAHISRWCWLQRIMWKIFFSHRISIWYASYYFISSKKKEGYDMCGLTWWQIGASKCVAVKKLKLFFFSRELRLTGNYQKSNEPIRPRTVAIQYNLNWRNLIAHPSSGRLAYRLFQGYWTAK